MVNMSKRQQHHQYDKCQLKAIYTSTMNKVEIIHLQGMLQLAQTTLFLNKQHKSCTICVQD